MGNSNGKPVVLTDKVNLNHFRLLRVVGKGAFGKVRIVERKDTGLTFALKYIRKDEVVRSESVRNIIRERRMLEHLNHPFLCNLRYSFQDMEYLYIVVDLMNGGDLRFHISRKTFTEEAVRFWISELGCALRYVHRQGIVHRDVKPDNVLLDGDGHVHLADFNVASDYTPAKPLTSKSGTLAYLAPEVYLGRGYQTEVDWWSLGVTFYECIYNRRPFEANNHEALAQSIIRAEPPFPATSPPVSVSCKHAISSLLEKNKTLRIGASSWESFIDNPFFREIDFVALEAKAVEPVFRPPSEKTNFDATYDLEELLLEEAPLEARARKQKPRAELREDATAQEIRADELHRMIETLFEPFDYTLLPAEREVAPAMQRGSSSASVPTPGYGPSSGSPTELAHRRPKEIRSFATTGSQTPGGNSISGSHTPSPSGSPPLPPATLPRYPSSPGRESQVSSALSSAENTPHPFREPVQNLATLHHRSLQREHVSQSPPPTSEPRAQPSSRTRWGAFSSGGGGGIQPLSFNSVMSSDTINLSQSTTQGTASEAEGAPRTEKPAGMLGFLRKSKGRDRSPKSKQRERGVLGKEGARVVVGS